MESYDVEVAVAFTDGTWEAVMTTVEDFTSQCQVEFVAEQKVLEDYGSGPRAVSFTKTIWIAPKEEEGDQDE